MRDYAKVSPKFWTGETGQALARRGSEALVVAIYLMTSPHSNMLGLYYQPTLYMAEETGLSPEGASKGLQDCIEEGFCRFDPVTKMVWVIEMAKYQIGERLEEKDKRCKGVQKDYDALPNCPFLPEFFDYYVQAFHLTERREFVVKSKPLTPGARSPLQAPLKQGTGTGTGEGTDPSGEDGKPSAKPAAEQSKTELWKSAVSLLTKQGMDEPQARSLIGKLAKDYKAAGEDIVLEAVRAAVAEQPADARAYLRATCQRMAGERRADGGQGDWTRTAE